jgi:hypothetical protein
MVTEAQLAESRRVSETAANQDSNDKPAEVEAGERDENEEDSTDVEADFDCYGHERSSGSLPPSQGSYSRHQDRVYRG